MKRKKSSRWTEEMLAYAANLLSQISDQVNLEKICASTGPSDDPDKFGVQELLDEIHKRRPNY